MQVQGSCSSLERKKKKIYHELVAARSAYTQKYTQRNFSVVEEDNKVYQELLESLSCDNLETYRQAANEQAKAAVEHFKDDFVFKNPQCDPRGLPEKR